MGTEVDGLTQFDTKVTSITVVTRQTIIFKEGVVKLSPLQRLQRNINEAERILRHYIESPHNASVDENIAAVSAYQSVGKAKKLVESGLSQLRLIDDDEDPAALADQETGELPAE